MHIDLSFRHVGPRLGATVLALAIASAAWGQSASDLSALRFYVQQNDQTAIQAEVQRLRATFPSWQPPQDLSQLGTVADPGADIDRIYQLIAAGDVAGAQGALDAARARFPDWTPPADMIALLGTTTAQQQFDAAVASDPARADQIARANPTLTRCDRINNVWRLAESQERGGQAAQALGAYQSIVAACPRYQDVSATLEKASSVATPAQLDALFATAARRFSANSTELTALQERLAAGRSSAPRAAAPSTTTAPRPAASPTPQRTASQPAAPAASVGGAISIPPSQWDGLPASGDGRLAAMRQATASGDWARCVALTPNPRSLDVLNERGWCSLNLDRPMEALASFSAVAKGRVQASVARDSRYGMAMTFLNMKMSNEAAKISAATNFTPSQRVEVEHEVLVQRGLEAYRVKDYRRAIGYLDAADQIRGLNRGLGVVRAYAYLNSGQRREALAQFTTMHNQMAGDDTRQGMNAARQD